jgi:DNA-binding NarL/FixJ family response regulator
VDAVTGQPGRLRGPAEEVVVTAGEAMPVRVLLVDDDALVRAGLTMMLEAFDGIEVAGAVADGTEVAAAVRTHRPDVVLMDIRMPGMDGLTATESLRRPDPARGGRPVPDRKPPEVIVLTTFDTDAHVLRALRAGASGFLLKHTPPEQIALAVRRVAAGEPMMSPEVLRRMMAYVAAADVDTARDEARAALARLSPGEREVALLVAQGRTNQEIGTALRMSTATVKAYVSRILTKLNLTNRVQVALLVHDSR